MSKKTAIWLTVAFVLIFAGGMLFAGVMASLKWDFLKLSTCETETNTYVIEEDFNGISINTSTSDVIFLPSKDGKTKVVCYEYAKLKHSVKASDGILTIEVTDEREWYDHIGIFIGSPKITVYLPEGEYESISVKVITGDVALTDVVAKERLTVKTSTGDVALIDCDALEISIKTSTGDVKGSILTEKSFTAKTSTGDVDVPKTQGTGKCEITSNTGDIKISITK